MDINQDKIAFKDFIKELKELYTYIKSKWKIIFLIGLTGVICGLIYSIKKKPVYTAVLTFALEEKTASGGISSIASNFGLNIGSSDGGAFAGENIIELMKSRLLIEKTLLSNVVIDNKQTLLINRFIKHSMMNEKSSRITDNEILDFDSTTREYFTRAQDSLLGIIQSKILKSSLKVSKIDKKLSIISVKITSEDEIFAKLFCEELVSNVSNFYIETKVGKSKKNVTLLQSRVDSVKKELDQAMYGKASFSDQNLSLVKQSAALPKLKQELRIQLLSALYSELIKNLEFSKLSLMREEPLIQVIDRPILPLNIEKIRKSIAMIFGGFIATFLVIAYIVIKKIISQLF